MTTIIAEIGKEIEDIATEATGNKKEMTPRISRQECVLFLRRDFAKKEKLAPSHTATSN